MRIQTVIGFLFMVVTAVPVAGQHAGDIYLGIEDDTLVTGAIGGDQTIDTSVSLFAGTFGDSGCPPFTANPGYDTLPGTFEEGTKIGWTAIEPLMAWNGTAFDLVDDEYVRFEFASLSFDVGAAVESGFELFVQPGGTFHIHLDMCMNGCENVCAPPDGADPGIYVVQLVLHNTAPDVADSAPFCLLFNYLDTPENLQTAAAWADQNLSCGSTATCSGDFDGDSAVGINDLLQLLSAWGACAGCAQDLDDDGTVGIGDLLALLAAWGPC